MTGLPTPAGLFDLTGKTALISGASGAVGSVTAAALAGAGATVVLAGSSTDKLEKLADEIRAAGAAAHVAVGRPDSVESAARLVARSVDAGGSLDIVVPAGGTNTPGPIVEQDPGEWDAIMDANLRQTWLLCREAGRQMLAQGTGGSVILLSSARGRHGLANYSAYCPSKGATDMLAKTLACEWGPHGIRVNAVAPTVFRSDVTAWMYGDDPRGTAVREGVLARLPLGRLGEPDDFSGVMVYLASAASAFMTGAVLRLDGGYAAT